jgi:hypothetical protein
MPRMGAARTTPAYVAGCAFRAVACCARRCSRSTRVYLLNEKGAAQAVDKLAPGRRHFAQARAQQAIAGLAAAGCRD